MNNYTSIREELALYSQVSRRISKFTCRGLDFTTNLTDGATSEVNDSSNDCGFDSVDTLEIKSRYLIIIS